MKLILNNASFREDLFTNLHLHRNILNFILEGEIDPDDDKFIEFAEHLIKTVEKNII